MRLFRHLLRLFKKRRVEEPFAEPHIYFYDENGKAHELVSLTGILLSIEAENQNAEGIDYHWGITLKTATGKSKFYLKALSKNARSFIARVRTCDLDAEITVKVIRDETNNILYVTQYDKTAYDYFRPSRGEKDTLPFNPDERARVLEEHVKSYLQPRIALNNP